MADVVPRPGPEPNSAAPANPEPPLDPATIAHLRRSWAGLAPLADLFALTLYRRLFERAPHLRGLFHADIVTQGRRVFDVLDQAMARLEEPASLRPMLEALGRRHFHVGVQRENFKELEAALLQTLADLMGRSLDDELRAAWARFYGSISAVMLRGYDAISAPPAS